MAICTPRGLIIRISVKEAFGLMYRLHPKVSAFEILKTVEGIEYIRVFFSMLIGVVFFTIQADPLTLAIASAGGYLAGFFFGRSRLYSYEFVKLSTKLSYFNGLFVDSTILIGIGFLTVGWKGVLFFLIGKFVAIGCGFVLRIMLDKRNPFPLTSSEINFFRAYQLHAAHNGISTDVELTDEELKSGEWKKPYAILAQEWPDVTDRFTDKPSVCGILEHDQLYYFTIKTN